MTTPPAGGRLLKVTVFVVGTGSLGAEIAAARLLAPYFGDSTLIWANTIGIVLVALSAGYWYGGNRADETPTPRALYRLVLLAGVLVALIPFVADPFLGVAVDALDAIQAGAFVGSLVAVLVLVAVPVFIMGMVSPYAVRLAVGRVEASGSVAGRLYALGTLGSLTGNFASALLLIPLVGTRPTFLVYALAFVVVAAIGLRSRLAWAPAVVILALFAAPDGMIKGEASRGSRVIYETQTRYQYARVVERANGDRALELNEGQATHSITPASGYLTGGIWDTFLIGPFAGRDTPPRRVAILGNAAGTASRAYGRYFPQTQIDGVELDGEVTQIGRDWFGMDNPRLQVFEADARPWLRQATGRYDVIVVDAYQQPYLPFYMATQEFFRLVRDRLAPGGVVIVNVGHPEGSTALERALASTMRTVFETVRRDPVDELSTALIAGAGEISGRRLAANAARLPADLRAPARAAAGRIGDALGGAHVYTDDHAPVEWLIDGSLLKVATGS